MNEYCNINIYIYVRKYVSIYIYTRMHPIQVKGSQKSQSQILDRTLFGTSLSSPSISWLQWPVIGSYLEGSNITTPEILKFNLEPEKCPLGRGKTSTNHQFWGSHVKLWGVYVNFTNCLKGLGGNSFHPKGPPQADLVQVTVKLQGSRCGIVLGRSG